MFKTLELGSALWVGFSVLEGMGLLLITGLEWVFTWVVGMLAIGRLCLIKSHHYGWSYRRKQVSGLRALFVSILQLWSVYS